MAKGGVLGKELNSVFAKRADAQGVNDMTADERFRMQQEAQDMEPRNAPRIQEANPAAEAALMQLAKQNAAPKESPMDEFSVGERRAGAEDMAPPAVAPQSAPVAPKLGGSGALQKRALNKKAETYSAIEPGTNMDQGPGY